MVKMGDKIAKAVRTGLIDRYYRRQVPEIKNALEKSQWLSREELERLQFAKLQKILEHAYRVIPFYSEKFRNAGLTPDDLKTLEDLSKFPPLSKEELRTNFDRISYREKGCKYTLTHSSGTMGKPIMILRDRYADSFCQAVRIRCLGWHGIDYYDRQARMWGLPLTEFDAKKTIVKDHLVGRKRFSPFNISAKTVPDFLRKIQTYRPVYLYGWLSASYELSRVMLEMGLSGKSLGLKGVVTTSEVLHKYQRNTILEAFRAPVINEYGCSECGILAFECPEGGLHVMSENVVLEFILNGRRARPGEAAEILVTDLKNFATPLIRYRIGDLVRYLDKTCACGRHLPLLEMRDGRLLDTVVAMDGTLVHGGLFCYAGFEIISRYGGIKDFRIIQRKDKSIEMTISKEQGYHDEILHTLTQIFHQYLGPLEIQYKFVDYIPTGVGKQRFVLSELEAEDRARHDGVIE